MPNFNPFNLDHEDTSFEQGMPVSQAAKNISQAVQKQADDAIKKVNDEIIAQLYGPSTLSEPGTDEANVQHTDANNAATRAASTHAAVSGQAGKTTANSNQTPEEQEKMEKIRHELFGNYSAKFQSAPNGAQPLNTNLEMAMEKARKEREQKEMQQKQAEEEEQRKKEEEEQQKQELDMPAGKKTGMMFGKKQQEPVALRLARTKTEINRGTNG